jgi:hypothetical protein
MGDPRGAIEDYTKAAETGNNENAKIIYNGKLSKKLLLLCEAEKNVDFPLRFKAGIEYQPIADFYFRGGFATEPIEYSFGVGYCYKKNYKLDIGSAYHQILGWSPHFSFTVQMN